MTAYPIYRLDSTIPDGFHNAALLIRNISDPVSLAGRHQHVGRPAIYMSVQLLVLVDLEIGRVFDGAAFTVMVTVLAVDGWVHSGKEASLGCFGKAVTQLGHGCGGVSRSKEGSAALQSGGEGGRHVKAVAADDDGG